MNEQPANEPLGQCEDAAVTVTRTVHHSLDTVWNALMAPHGAEALLGEGAVLGNKGDDWHANDGTRGVLRSFHPKEQIRFSFHEHEDAPRSMVELDLCSQDEGTELKITQSQLPAGSDCSVLTDRWKKVLDRIDAACS